MDRDTPKSAYIEELCASSMGETLGRELCRELSARGDIVRWTRDSLVFREGDPGTRLFIILEGRLKLVRYSRDGRETILHFAEKHQMIAEAVIFLGKYPASAITLVDTTLLSIPATEAIQLFERHPEYMRTVFNTMSKWMLRLVDKIDRLTLHDARSRLTHYLLELHRSGDGSDDMAFPAKKGEIALLLNMDQATFSRILRTLQDEKLVDVQGRSIKILDVSALKESLFAPPPGDF